MNYLKIMFASLVVLTFTGCSSKQVADFKSPLLLPIDNPIYADQEFGDLVTNLNNAGQGKVTNCSITETLSTIETGYSNQLDQARFFIAARDRYIVNSVALYLNSDELQKFRETLQNAPEKAQNNKALENLTVGKYNQYRTEVEFISRYGKLSGYWSDFPDLVLTPINANELLLCIDQVSEHL